MTRKLISLAVSGVLAAAAGFAPAPAFAQGAEIEALKAQLAALSAKIEALEKAQTQTTKTVAETQATADKTADTVAQARSALSFAGDLRYRYEIFDVQYVDRDRERDRIRARFNANFRVNDTITGRIGIATGGQDPRSSNQTLTDQNQRKDFDLDVAYVTWAPTHGLEAHRRQAAVCLDAHRQPVLRRRHQSRRRVGQLRHGQLLRGDVLRLAGRARAVLQQRDHGHEHGLHHVRRAGRVPHSVLGFGAPDAGGQLLRLRQRAGLQHRSSVAAPSATPRWSASRNGCSRTLAAGTACLASDFNIIEASADLTASLGGKPLRFFIDYAQNQEAEINATAQEKLDTAYATGITYGAASAAKGTWEFGVLYQQVEKDALFGQLLDSDFGDGNTDTKGFVFRGGYTVARNWTLNATLFLNDLANDVPQNGIVVFNEATAAPLDTTTINGVFDRDYKRLQLDLNFRF